MTRSKTQNNKYYTVIVIPENDTSSRSFKLKSSYLRFFLWTGTLVFLFLSYLLYAYHDVIYKSVIVDKILEENKILKQNFYKINDLKSQLMRVQEYRKKAIKSIQGFENIEVERDSLISDFIDYSQNLSKLVSAAEIVYETVPSKSPIDNPIISRGFETYLADQSDHFGIDIVAKMGSSVYSAAAGIVMFSGWTVKYGHTLILLHADGYITVYKHNQNINVVEGQKIRKGDIIAYLGDTGKISSGAHLHFEIWKNGIPINPMNLISDLNRKAD
jgi:murein DD-endopeptidase MepM/ murein hydrolase activator NlpD